MLIVGGGAVAFRKSKSLLDAGAKITLVGPDLNPEFKQLGKITRITKGYQSTHMTARKWCLVFAATNLPSVNARVQKDAVKAGVLCCRCDAPSKGQFTNAAVGQLGPVTIAISTAGSAPAISLRLRDHVLASADNTLITLAELHATWRSQIQTALPSIALRRSLLRQLAGDEMESCLRHEGRAAAQRLFKRWLTTSIKQFPRTLLRATAHAK